jgi:UTP--glucose-1-phosphate uridylyltransferase
MNSRVTRALIPCGGKGTRMAALTGGIAKELLPIGGVPLVLRVMEECAASGIDEVLIVSAPGKADLERTVTSAAGKPGMPRNVEVRIQEEPRGLADAIRYGRNFADSSPLAVALPDNLFIGDTPALSQVIELHQSSKKSVVAIVEITAANRHRYGPTAVFPGAAQGEEFLIERIPDKGPRTRTFDPQGAESAFTGVGRYVFEADVFATIDEVEATLPDGQELDDVPVMKLLLRRNQLTGRLLRGDFLDVGIPSGYLEANQRFEMKL